LKVVGLIRPIRALLQIEQPIETSSMNSGEEIIVIKVSVFLTHRPDLSHEQFSAYWREKHAPLALSLGPLRSLARRYVQQRPAERVPNQLPLAPSDGIAEVWFDNLDDALKLLGHELFLSVIAKDEENFLDRSRTAIFISEETKII
jgi:uncharacterized protein (TIGR02118 family)